MIESSWTKAMKKPLSLSNVASSLALNDFPCLPTPAVPKPANSLLPGSVWAKGSRSVVQVPFLHDFNKIGRGSEYLS